MKFFLKLLIMAVLILQSVPVQAEIVHAIGQGVTKQAAIHSAMRHAIEKQLGVIIDSKILVQNKQLISSEIIAKSYGFVESYEIIRENVINGDFEVEIEANISEEKLNTSVMSFVQKRNIVNTNFNDPRIAVIAIDDYGMEYAQAENEIITALQNQGFNRLVDLEQLDSSLKMKLNNAADDPDLRSSLKNQFHVDYVVISKIKSTQTVKGPIVNLTIRMIGVNTGEIIYAGTFISNTRMFTQSTFDGALQNVSKRAGQALAGAALQRAAQVEQHITVLVTSNTLARFGGSLNNLIGQLRQLNGVNEIFTRSVNSRITTIDVNFDGTSHDLAVELENHNITIIEMNSEYIKI